MARALAHEYVFDFTGGNLCLDFTNTLDGTRTSPTERLKTYPDLVAWGRQADILSDGEARQLAQLAAGHPRDAARVLTKAVAIRELLYRIFSSVIDGSPTRPEDLATLNAALSPTLDRLRIGARARGFGWAWAPAGDALDRMLWPVLRSAGDLLVSGELRGVRRCAGETCNWLFLDTSRNHSRRWCDMRSCGNRAKARRHYARKKAASGGGAR